MPHSYILALNSHSWRWALATATIKNPGQEKQTNHRKATLIYRKYVCVYVSAKLYEEIFRIPNAQPSNAIHIHALNASNNKIQNTNKYIHIHRKSQPG